jgi:phage baseplate assembly protein W
MSQEFLGIGWQFPIGVDSEGRISMSRDEASIRQSILMILQTARGERQMRPDFGCQVHALVFSENSISAAAQAAYFVEEALSRWEPRIVLLRVQGTPDEQSGNRLLIQIEYRVIATNSVFNLVYPFYLTEGAGQ